MLCLLLWMKAKFNLMLFFFLCFLKDIHWLFSSSFLLSWSPNKQCLLMHVDRKERRRRRRRHPSTAARSFFSTTRRERERETTDWYKYYDFRRFSKALSCQRLHFFLIDRWWSSTADTNKKELTQSWHIEILASTTSADAGNEDELFSTSRCVACLLFV